MDYFHYNFDKEKEENDNNKKKRRKRGAANLSQNGRDDNNKINPVIQ